MEHQFTGTEALLPMVNLLAPRLSVKFGLWQQRTMILRIG